MSDYKEKCRKDIRFVAKFILWLMAAVVVTLMFISLLSAEDVIIMDGWLDISWEKPDKIDNVKGYRLEIYGLEKNIIKSFDGVEPPINVSYPYAPNNYIAIVKIYSIDSLGKPLGYAQKSIKLMAPDSPKNLEVK